MTLDHTAGGLPKHCRQVAEALTAGQLLKHSEQPWTGLPMSSMGAPLTDPLEML